MKAQEWCQKHFPWKENENENEGLRFKADFYDYHQIFYYGEEDIYEVSSETGESFNAPCGVSPHLRYLNGIWLLILPGFHAGRRYCRFCAEAGTVFGEGRRSAD
jgi:hypothetical protein